MEFISFCSIRFFIALFLIGNSQCCWNITCFYKQAYYYNIVKQRMNARIVSHNFTDESKANLSNHQWNQISPLQNSLTFDHSLFFNPIKKNWLKFQNACHCKFGSVSLWKITVILICLYRKRRKLKERKCLPYIPSISLRQPMTVSWMWLPSRPSCTTVSRSTESQTTSPILWVSSDQPRTSL